MPWAQWYGNVVAQQPPLEGLNPKWAESILHCRFLDHRYGNPETNLSSC
jgi:hypothetical protein